jgi:hypothetical protein
MDRSPYGLSENYSNSKPEARQTLLTILIPFGSLIVAGIGLLGKETPWWGIAIALAYVALIIIVLISPFIPKIYKSAKNSIARRSIAKTYHLKVLQFLATLSPAMEDNRSGTIFEVYRNAYPLDKEIKYLRYDYNHIDTLRVWIKHVNERFTKSKNKDFYALCGELVDLVIHYNMLCKQIHDGIQNLINSGSLKESEIKNLKQRWNSNREKHNHTIKIWEDMAKAMNRDAGEQVVFDHYDSLETIE